MFGAGAVWGPRGPLGIGVGQKMWLESGVVIPVIETRMSKSLRKGRRLVKGSRRRVRDGWGLWLLHPAVLSLPLNLGKQNRWAGPPALSVTSSGMNCPGLKKKKKRKRKKKKKESPHYMVGYPHTRDKILWVAHCSAPRIFDIPCFTYSILNTWDTDITVFILVFFTLSFFFLSVMA